MSVYVAAILDLSAYILHYTLFYLFSFISPHYSLLSLCSGHEDTKQKGEIFIVFSGDFPSPALGEHSWV